ncbi:MAG: hypothetical protein ACAI44_27155 [Candidatus Sericytochromatia bacterium]
MNAALPAEAEVLLQQLLTLTQSLQAALAGTDEELQALLDQRQALLDRLGALPEASRRLTPRAGQLLLQIQQIADKLLDALEERRQDLNLSQSEIRTAYSAMQAYHPADPTESIYFEEQS